MDIILASKSPRRKEILLKHGYNIEIIPSDYNEDINGCMYTDELVKNCAIQKGIDVQKRIETDKVIVSSDTVVVLNNIILGKPVSRQDAINMLFSLSGKQHFVATAISVLSGNKNLSDVDKTYVKFRNLNEFDIINYVDKKKPFDKAGSYGIQDDGFDFVAELNGEIDNVIGFPIGLFERLIKLV